MLLCYFVQLKQRVQGLIRTLTWTDSKSKGIVAFIFMRQLKIYLNLTLRKHLYLLKFMKALYQTVNFSHSLFFLHLVFYAQFLFDQSLLC